MLPVTPGMPASLSVTVCGIEFPSLILNASGCFNPEIFNNLHPLSECLGGIVTKTVTPEPTIGNPQQRTVELPGIGMLNSIGLQNPGLEHFLDVEATVLKDYGIPLILSISAKSMAAYEAMAGQISAHPNGALVDALEVNLSCPNIAIGGVDFGASPELVRDAIRATIRGFSKPVFAKLTPNVTSILPVTEAALDGGAHGITAINTLLGMAIDIRRKKPYLPRVSGGYSGPGIKPVALHLIWQIRKHFPEVPILGVGGISTAEDVLEFLMAGATLVQVGTICFRSPMIFARMTAALQDYARVEGLERLSDLTACAHDRKMDAATLPENTVAIAPDPV